MENWRLLHSCFLNIIESGVADVIGIRGIGLIGASDSSKIKRL